MRSFTRFIVPFIAGLITLAAHAGPGALDPNFGTAGTRTLSGLFPTAALQPDGRIVMILRPGDFKSGPFTVTRLNANGTSDATFGTTGTITFTPPCAQCGYRMSAVT